MPARQFPSRSMHSPCLRGEDPIENRECRSAEARCAKSYFFAPRQRAAAEFGEFLKHMKTFILRDFLLYL